MNRRAFKAFGVFLLIGFSLLCLPAVHADNLLPVGSNVPHLEAVNQEGNVVDLGGILKEKGVTLLYFYPKAGTPGCTAQACSLRDGMSNLEKLDVRVIGVSRDTPESQKKFKEKYQLPFMLIADVNGGVSEAFGVGNTLGMTHRTAFLIKDGKVVKVIPKAKTSGHAEEVVEALKKL